MLQQFCIYKFSTCNVIVHDNMFCTSTLALSAVCVQCSIWLFYSYLISCFPVMLIRCFLCDFEMVSVAPSITGVTFVFTFHIS